MGNPGPNDAPTAYWAWRAKRAHMNAIENLAVFAPLVLVAAVAGIGTPATIVAAKVYPWPGLPITSFTPPVYRFFARFCS